MIPQKHFWEISKTFFRHQVSNEEQRSVYRALTHLRGLYMSSFDGMAQASIANIKEYGEKSDWVGTHEPKHLAEEEANVNEWAFPNK